MAIAIAGTHSGVGKTTVTLAILAALRQWQIKIQSFKVGPDYIDPMFHTEITGRACRNLDPVLTSPTYVQKCFVRHSVSAEGAVIEGVMGLFDGAGSTEFASTAHVVKLLGSMVSTLLVVDCSKISRSIAALIYGYQNFDPDLKLAGLILNRVGSDRHRQLLLEAITPLEIPVLGIIPREESIKLSDRHLGLIPTAEVVNFSATIDLLADLGTKCFDWKQLLPLVLHQTSMNLPQQAVMQFTKPKPVRIAVARDRAFSFYYADNLDLLEQMGSELIYWSPLQDLELPEHIQGLYFGGGFPEVFAAELAGNHGAIAAIRKCTNLPIYAECGGLMYLSDSITNFEGQSFPMIGRLPTQTVMTNKLTLGYRRCYLSKPHAWFPARHAIFGHEFHRSKEPVPSSNPLYRLSNYSGSSLGSEGWSVNNVVASYVHLHWGSNPIIPYKFVLACAKSQTTRENPKLRENINTVP